MWWQTVPCCWTSIAEAAFTKLGSCVSFDVVGCFSWPQASLTARGYRLYGVSQILWCSAGVDQMHQQAEFELDPACDWQPCCFREGVTWSHRRRLSTRLAAAFYTWTGGFCWLPTCRCWWQVAYSDSGEDDKSFPLSGVTYTVSIPYHLYSVKREHNSDINM